MCCLLIPHPTQNLYLVVFVMSPAIIWQITGDIMHAYKRTPIDEIAAHCTGLAAGGDQFTSGDLETGQQKS